jgi:ABC-2 type transport system permease protein
MGYFQINTVFSLFIPLILIFMVVPRLPYESGSGILRILESQGILPREILLGKSLGAWGVACLVFILPLLVLGSTVLLATSSDTYLHFVSYVLQTAVYYLLWCFVFVTVSSYFRTESTAIGAALGIFIVQSLVIPRIVPTVAETLLPEMGTGQFKQRLYAELAKSPNGHRPGGPEFDLFKKQLMEKHGVAKVEDLPFNYEGLVMQKAEEHSTRVFQAAFEEQWGLFSRQERLAISLAFFSPTAIHRILSMHFSRSHSSDQRHFELAVEEHRNGMNRDLNALLTSLPYQDRKTKKLPASTWAGIPTFKMEGMPFKHSLSYAIPALLILVFQTGWAVLILLRRRSLCA